MSDRDSKESFAAMFEEAGSTQSAALRRLHRGERLDVRVVSIGRDAVFVDVGGRQEGAIDRVELLGTNGELMVEVGSMVNCVVAETGERIRLSPTFVRKQAESGLIDDDGEVVAIPRAGGGPLMLEGAIVRGTVSGVERYGVFVQIEGTHGNRGRGLIPTNETATARGADLRKLFVVGSAIEAKIIRIEDDGKIRLSLQALGEETERKQFEEYASGDEKPTEGNKPKKSPGPEKLKSFGTLGDLLSKRGGKGR